MASLQDIINSATGILEQAKSVSGNVQAIILPSIKAGANIPAEIEATSPTDPAEPAPGVVRSNPMLKWYIGGAVVIIALFVILRKR